MRAIGVSHTACKDEFDEIFDLTTGGYFHFFQHVLFKCLRTPHLNSKSAIVINTTYHIMVSLAFHGVQAPILFDALPLSLLPLPLVQTPNPKSKSAKIINMTTQLISLHHLSSHPCSSSNIPPRPLRPHHPYHRLDLAKRV